MCSSMAGSVSASMIEGPFADAFQDSLNQLLADTCGAIDPYYWQPCYPILDD